jgi:polyisoprenoid-binding protein YceI
VVFADENPTLVQGSLTLLGVTRAVLLTISEYRCEGASSSTGSSLTSRAIHGSTPAKGCVLSANATFRRSEFGMNHYMALVSDVVTLEVRGVISPGP